MSERLSITFIDVGWGDSILVESEDYLGNSYYGLIDSNDTVHQPSSLLFLKRFFERKNVPFERPARVFSFVLLTHAHADHAAGLPRILRKFGADYFLYSESSSPSNPLLAQMVRYARRPGTRLGSTQPVRYGIPLGHVPFGPAKLEVLWPDGGYFTSDENNHSVVLALTLNDVSFLLTADAIADVWPNIVNRLPAGLAVFQVPHHGANNGTYDVAKDMPWVRHLLRSGGPDHFAISCHPRPHGHPYAGIVDLLKVVFSSRKKTSSIRRTDLDYHLRFETDGVGTRSYYTHD